MIDNQISMFLSHSIFRKKKKLQLSHWQKKNDGKFLFDW